MMPNKGVNNGKPLASGGEIETGCRLVGESVGADCCLPIFDGAGETEEGAKEGRTAVRPYEIPTFANIVRKFVAQVDQLRQDLSDGRTCIHGYIPEHGHDTPPPPPPIPQEFDGEGMQSRGEDDQPLYAYQRPMQPDPALAAILTELKGLRADTAVFARQLEQIRGEAGCTREILGYIQRDTAELRTRAKSNS